MSRTTIVVPCYNEAARLAGPQFCDFARRRPRLRFLFVNDGSTDDTARVLNRLERQQPSQLQALHLDQNGGKAEAVRRGLLAAAASADSDYLGYWDADLATPLDEIPRFAEILDRCGAVQLVAGVRLPMLGRRVRRRPLRRLLGRAFCAAAGLALGQGVCDTQCGAKLFRWGPAVEQVFREPFLSRWIFDVEILARLRIVLGDAPGAVYELPVEDWHDVSGSKVRPRDFVRAFRDLTQIYWRYRVARNWRPQAIFDLDRAATIRVNAGAIHRRAA